MIIWLDMPDSLNGLRTILPFRECSPASREKPCINSVREQMIGFARALDYDFLRCGWQKKGANLKSKHAPGVFISTIPEDFEKAYIERYYQHDPLLRFTSDTGASDYMPFGDWHSVHVAALANPLGETRAEQDRYRHCVNTLFEECKRLGMGSGVFMQFSQSEYLLSISLSNAENPETHKKKLTHDFWCTLRLALLCLGDLSRGIDGCERCERGYLFGNYGVVKLTKKQQVILRSILENPTASIADIAVIHCCTASNVKYHLSAIRKLFGLEGASGYLLAQHALRHNYI